jgi:hypothetical protein
MTETNEFQEANEMGADPVDPDEYRNVTETMGPGIDRPPQATGLHTSTDHANRVRNPDEGARAPSAEELGFAEHSVYDGEGNEVVVVQGLDEQGRPAQGFGETREEAMKSARRAGYPDEFTPG